MIELIDSFDVKALIVGLFSICFLLAGIIIKGFNKRQDKVEENLEHKLNEMAQSRAAMHEENRTQLYGITTRLEILGLHNLRLQEAEKDIESLRNKVHDNTKHISRHEGRIDTLDRLFNQAAQR